MKKIIDKINECEYDYHLEKHRVENPEDALCLAAHSKLQSINKLPNLMQYWAAAEGFADPIRNAKNHRLVVAHLNKWSALIENNPNKKSALKNSRNSFFNASDDDQPDRELSASRKLEFN